MNAESSEHPNIDEPFRIEERGAAEGINPMFGRWSQEFHLEPVSYSNASSRRAEFKQSVRSQLRNKYVFVGDISLRITLYLEEQKILETPECGDIDNHAKQILDTIKGNGGLIIDDCQVQRLDISWIDMPSGTRFDMEINASPDDFLPTPLRLLEMPDGLYYPFSDRVWTTNGIASCTKEDIYRVASILAEMTRNKRSLRHVLRQSGLVQFRAFEYGKYVSPALRGFHRSNIVDSGFEVVPLSSWSNAEI